MPPKGNGDPPKFAGSGAPCPSADLRAPSLGRSPGHRPRLLDSEPCAAGPSTPSPDPLPVPRPLHQSPPAILSLYLYLLEPGFCLPCTCAHRHEQGRGHLPRPQPCPSISPSPQPRGRLNRPPAPPGSTVRGAPTKQRRLLIWGKPSGRFLSGFPGSLACFHPGEVSLVPD